MLAQSDQLPYLEVLLAIFVKIFPLLDFLMHFLPRLPSLPLCPCLSLSTADNLVFNIVHGNVNQLCIPHVVCGVFEETASYESACCISASEDAVTATRTVGTAAGGNVEDGAVYTLSGQRN
jgi:hypothetical protein